MNQRQGASTVYGEPDTGSSNKMKLPGLKEWRERRGMNQQDLALAARLNQQSVSRVERGTKECSESTARRLAGVLGVDLAELQRPPEEGRSKTRASHPSLHRAYLKLILAKEVGSAYAAMSEGELGSHCRRLSWEGILEVLSSKRREVRFLEELKGVEDLHPEARRFFEEVVREAPDQDIRLLSAARTWERSQRGREELERAMRELL